MDFISFSYVGLFSLVFINRLTIGRHKTDAPFVVLLILVSALFYAWHIPSFILILMSSAIVDYYAGLYLGREPWMIVTEDGHLVESTRDRKLVLFMSLAVNLGLLFYFKYTNFALDEIRALPQFSWFRTTLHNLRVPISTFEGAIPHLDVILPMGISFYTFASLSYTIDVYRREIPPVRSFWKFFLFICFFPHLVAGPIVRASMFLPQMDRRRKLRLRVFNAGAFMIIRGLFLKMVCANNLGTWVAAYWNQGCAPGADSGMLLLLALMFSCQIFCDFEGYTSIAVGTAYLLGYRLPLNFNNPYIGSSFKNFWERWHITLSQWLRDYLYIPLGGNRGPKWRTYANLLVVMILGGLWHGANMTFVVWGAIHGGMLALEKLLGFERMNRWTGRGFLPVKLAWFLVVQAVVIVAWIFFRSETLGGAVQFLKNIAALNFASIPADLWKYCWIGILPVVLMHLRGFLAEKAVLPEAGLREKAIWAGVMLYAILTCYGENNVFIYFQF